MTNEKHFPKTISQWDFDYSLFTNLPRIIVTYDFSPSSFNSKEVSYLPWQKKYPNLKTTCHVNPKCFLWTKLPKNLLLAKYLIYSGLSLSRLLSLSLSNFSLFRTKSSVPWTFVYSLSYFYLSILNFCISNFSLSRTKILVPWDYFSLYLELFPV